MPAMPRFEKKATKIAFKILGTPANLAYRPNREKREEDRRLEYEETFRVR